MERASTEIHVVIADDHPIFRKGLRPILESEPHLVIVGEAADGEQALALIRTVRPHVAVLDLDMPHKNGLAVAREVRALGLDVAIVLLTVQRRPHRRAASRQHRDQARSERPARAAAVRERAQGPDLTRLASARAWDACVLLRTDVRTGTDAAGPASAHAVGRAMPAIETETGATLLIVTETEAMCRLIRSVR